MEKIQLLEGERVDDLQCNGYQIIQHPGLFRFGTDAVLLQNFARLQKNAKAVDMGTGTGILPILICARQPQVRFDAIEIQPACADMARRSVRMNALEQRITVHTMDLKDAPAVLGHNQYDAVICNPPYGKRGSVLHNPNDALAIARHEVLTDLETVIASGVALLRNGGRFFMIHQAERLTEITCLMDKLRTPLKRVRLVHQTLERRAYLVLCEGVKQASTGCAFLPPLILRGPDGSTTAELTRIYNGEKTV